MDPMTDVSMCNQLLVAHLSHAMPCYGLQLEKVWHLSPQIKPKIDGISSHDTLSVAAEPLHVLHMDPMSDVYMCNQILVAQHLCHAMPCCFLDCGWEMFGTCHLKSNPKLMAFPAMTPYQLLLNNSMSSIWIQ
jgi:hypothetical protein